jgi:hypothetical protein
MNIFYTLHSIRGRNIFVSNDIEIDFGSHILQGGVKETVGTLLIWSRVFPPPPKKKGTF